MLNELIIEGEKLESEAIEGLASIKYFKSVNFEVWVTKSILYLETIHADSLVTEKVKSQYKSLNSNTNYDFYQLLLGSLKGFKEYMENQQKQAEEFTL